MQRKFRSAAHVAAAVVLLISSSMPDSSRAGERPTVLIVYFSQAGHTRALAAAVAEGARGVDSVRVIVQSVDTAKAAVVLQADAIIVGCPVHNANIPPAMQSFINKWPFQGSPLRDKIGAAFVTSGGISAGEELVQLNILHAMLINRMIIVGGPEWQGAFGASAVVEEEPFARAQSGAPVAEHFLQKGRALGRRVAELTRRWKKAAKF